jgi:hypothetical protein
MVTDLFLRYMTLVLSMVAEGKFKSPTMLVKAKNANQAPKDCHLTELKVKFINIQIKHLNPATIQTREKAKKMKALTPHVYKAGLGRCSDNYLFRHIHQNIYQHVLV